MIALIIHLSKQSKSASLCSGLVAIDDSASSMTWQKCWRNWTDWSRRRELAWNIVLCWFVDDVSTIFSSCNQCLQVLTQKQWKTRRNIKNQEAFFLFSLLCLQTYMLNQGIVKRNNKQQLHQEQKSIFHLFMLCFLSLVALEKNVSKKKTKEWKKKKKLHKKNVMKTKGDCTWVT